MYVAQEFTTFHELVSVLSLNTPHALISDWWRRLSRAMDYFVVAYYGEARRTSIESMELLAADTRIGPNVAARLHGLRRIRNRIEHGPTPQVWPAEAAAYAQEALDLIGLIGNAVPNELAIRSGAACVV